VASGNCGVEGAPWAPSDKGTGHVWPVLSAERGEQALATGSPAFAGQLLGAIDAMSSGVGLVPEQDWDVPDVAASPFGTDPTTASIGFVNGKPAGSAAPLTWGAASQVRLTADLTAGRAIERPAQTVDRYITHTQKGTALTVTSPPDQTVATDPIQVSGTAVPGATIDVADVAATTTHVGGTVGAGGSFSFTIPAAIGNNVLVVTSTAPDGGTAQTVRTVVNDVVQGDLIYDTADPLNDDNGPGLYAYPTSSNFKPGAYDLTDFQVYDTGPTVTFRVQTRDLTPTFGSPLGAQLVDVYVHNPGAPAGSTSTAASFPQRNYTIAGTDAWNRLLEVQGFGQRFVDASNANAVGTISISANQISRYITFSVDKSALGGTPTTGWTFTVVLTGQDGFSPDQARGFQPTPQDFQFGLCATAIADPHCTADPTTVPKVMDTIPPPGVLQSAELDYIAHPSIVLSGVTVP
jgi:carbohydrate-binding DOMON domain-containing protein